MVMRHGLDCSVADRGEERAMQCEAQRMIITICKARKKASHCTALLERLSVLGYRKKSHRPAQAQRRMTVCSWVRDIRPAFKPGSNTQLLRASSIHAKTHSYVVYCWSSTETDVSIANSNLLEFCLPSGNTVSCVVCQSCWSWKSVSWISVKFLVSEMWV